MEKKQKQAILLVVDFKQKRLMYTIDFNQKVTNSDKKVLEHIKALGRKAS